MAIYYNAAQVDTLLAGKADIGHTHPQLGTDLYEIIRNVTIEMLSNSSGDVAASYDPAEGWTYRVTGPVGTVNVADKVEFRDESGTVIADVMAVPGAGAVVHVNEMGQPIGSLEIGNMKNGVFTAFGEINSQGTHVPKATMPALTVTTHNFDTYMPVGNSDQSIDTGLSRALFDAPGGILVVNRGGDFSGGVTCPTEIGAASFNVLSRRDAKDEISGFFGAIDILRKVKLARFNYVTDSDETPPRLGILADQSPSIVSAGGKAMDIANLAGVVFAAVKELIARQELIEAGGASCP